MVMNQGNPLLDQLVKFYPLENSYLYGSFFYCRRNDFISVVRNAARTALENMKIPEAQQVLSVTKVLEDEIAALEGGQAAV